MPATRSVTALAGRPYGLFEALLRGDAAAALRLLEAGAAPGADPPALLFAVGESSSLTALHAAAVGGCAAAIPALVAAGAQVDAPLQLPTGVLWSDAAAPLRELLQACGRDPCAVTYGTAVALAVGKADIPCVRQLLEHGADPAAGGVYRSASWALLHLDGKDPCACEPLLPLFLQHGLDPLAPLAPEQAHFGSLLSSTSSETAEILLAHLEQQRAGGSLQLDSTERAAQLVIGVARSSTGQRHLPLARHGIAALEQLLGLAGGDNADGGLLPAADAGTLQLLLRRVVHAGQPAVLDVLLASRLPFDLAARMPAWDLQPLSMAAQRPNAAACVRLLHQAGAAVTAADLYRAIDELRPDGVSALLACGVPAVDVSVPAAPGPFLYRWSCPIHRALYAASRQDTMKRQRTARILEALWAAGYRPTVYRQARLPAFLSPAADAPAIAELDPLALYDAAHPQHAQLRRLVPQWYAKLYQSTDLATMQRLLFLARTGGAWSPATHQYWPPAFKHATHTLLLCAAAGGSGGSTAEAGQHVTRAAARRRPQRSPSEAARLLGCLPPCVLLHVLKLAAEPLSSWMHINV